MGCYVVNFKSNSYIKPVNWSPCSSPHTDYVITVEANTSAGYGNRSDELHVQTSRQCAVCVCVCVCARARVCVCIYCVLCECLGVLLMCAWIVGVFCVVALYSL